MMMSGYGVIASSNLFLLDSYPDLIDINSELLMTGTMIGIPRNHANYWTIHWDNGSLKKKIQKKSLQSQVMKGDHKMAEHLFDIFSRFQSFVDCLVFKFLIMNYAKD